METFSNKEKDPGPAKFSKVTFHVSHKLVKESVRV